MKLQEAIEILDITKAPPLMHPESKYNKALKLGIEALKRVEDMRISPCTTADEILPSETE